MFRFLCDDGPQNYNGSIQGESVFTLKNTYQSGHHLHMEMNKSESKDIPPLLPTKHRIKSSNFRPRTSVMSLSQAKKCKTICKSKMNNERSQNTWIDNGMNNLPVLPPKDAKLIKGADKLTSVPTPVTVPSFCEDSKEVCG